MTEDPWVVQLRADDPIRSQALKTLGTLLQRGLERSLAVRYGVPFQIDDIVQESLLKILRSLDQFEGRCQFTTWAMTIATRIGISHLRHAYRREVSLDSLTQDGNQPLSVTDQNASATLESQDRREVLMCLQTLIDTLLTDRQRIAIRFQLEGIPVDETAVRMQSNRNAVYKLVHDARSKLRTGLEAHGFTMDYVQSIFNGDRSP